MDEFINEDLTTSFADESLHELKNDRLKPGPRLEDCLYILDKPAGAQTNEEINRFAKTLVTLGIFDRSSFGNLEPVGFLKKLMPYMRHEVYPLGSALLHINHPQEKACIIVRGKAKEFVPRNAKEMEIESRNSLSNIRNEKKFAKTVIELTDSDNKLLKPKNMNPNQPKSLTSILEENEQDMLSPAKKRRVGRSTKANRPIKSNNNNGISINSLDKPLSARNTVQDEPTESKLTLLKSSSKSSSNGSIAGTLGNLDEEGNNEEFMEEFKKYAKNYFVGEVLKIKHSKTLTAGSYFGTKAFGKKINAKQAIMAAEECHCITLHTDDYLAALAAEKTVHRDKIDFFLNIFPAFNQESVTEFSLLWDEQLHKRGDVIFSENNHSNLLYIVFNGEITISKEVNDPLAARRGSDGMGIAKKKGLNALQVATFCQSSFFGEEFFEKKPRVFTATTSSSKAKILHLSRRDYRAIATKYSEIFEKIKEMVKLSSKVNNQRLENLFQTHNIDLNREAMQEAFLNQKEQVLKSERPLRSTHTKAVSMIMKPTKKPKNINVRLQYDKYFVCKPGQKYPEYLKMVIEGNIKPDPTEKNQLHSDSKRSGTTIGEQKRRLSTPLLGESEDIEIGLNFLNKQGHQRTPSLYKMTQIPMLREDDSKYTLSAPQTFRLVANSSAQASERASVEDPLLRQQYYQGIESRRSVGLAGRESSVDAEPLAATSTMIPLKLNELDLNQRNEARLVLSDRKYSKAMKGLSSKYTDREKSQVNSYVPVGIVSSQNSYTVTTSKIPINNKLLSGQKDSAHIVAKSLNNLPSLPSTILPQTKLNIIEKLKGADNSMLPALRSPRKKVGSLNDLNDIFSTQKINSLKKL